MDARKKNTNKLEVMEQHGKRNNKRKSAKDKLPKEGETKSRYAARRERRRNAKKLAGEVEDNELSKLAVIYSVYCFNIFPIFPAFY